MIRYLKQAYAEYSLREEQRQVARELQAVFDMRKRLIADEAYLVKYAQRLAVQEVTLHIESRRAV